ncbi:hypothetical protein [Ectobacillus panaciterrae]|uniref:hypothetical protein n=1 Tax=Ectobacillus panaciterrae TaxID=363872 RepID=UPI003CCBAB38
MQSDYFSVYKWKVEEHGTFQSLEMFQLLSVIEGEGEIRTTCGTFPIQKGNHMILLCDIGEFEIHGSVTLIVSHP